MSVDLKSIANDYNAQHGRPKIDTRTVGVDPRHAEAGMAYRKMKHEPNNPKVKAAYGAMHSEVKDQWKHLQKHGFTMTVGSATEQPYKDHKDMLHDIHTNKHIQVFGGGAPPADHPMAQVDPETGHTHNHLFRAVHDIMGHGISGHDFSEHGEENAFRHHAQMFSKEAMPAVTTETKGQTSSYFNNRHKVGKFPSQKAGLLPTKFHTPTNESTGDVMDTRQKNTKTIQQLIALNEKKAIRKDGTLMERIVVAEAIGDEHQPTQDDAARTGLGRLAQAMQPSFSIDAGGHNGRESNGIEANGRVPQLGDNPGKPLPEDEAKLSGAVVPPTEGEEVQAEAEQGGTPIPRTGEPRQDLGQISMGTQDPMGKDAPVKTQYYSSNGKQDGMVVPATVRGEYDADFFRTASDKALIQSFREGIIDDAREEFGEGATDRDIFLQLIQKHEMSVEEAYQLVYESLDEIADDQQLPADVRNDMIEAIKRRMNRGGVAMRSKQFREGAEAPATSPKGGKLRLKKVAAKCSHPGTNTTFKDKNGKTRCDNCSESLEESAAAAKLKTQAKLKALANGHKLGSFSHVVAGSMIAQCKNCHKNVHVDVGDHGTLGRLLGPVGGEAYFSKCKTKNESIEEVNKNAPHYHAYKAQANANGNANRLARGGYTRGDLGAVGRLSKEGFACELCATDYDKRALTPNRADVLFTHKTKKSIAACNDCASKFGKKKNESYDFKNSVKDVANARKKLFPPGTPGKQLPADDGPVATGDCSMCGSPTTGRLAGKKGICRSCLRDEYGD